MYLDRLWLVNQIDACIKSGRTRESNQTVLGTKMGVGTGHECHGTGRSTYTFSCNSKAKGGTPAVVNAVNVTLFVRVCDKHT